MEFTFHNLCGFLIRSKLMTPDEMLAMRERWTAEAKDPNQATAFLKWLVRGQYITEYQAALLGRGHTDDFFLGEYKILERIGRGRMAGVYKAIHPLGQVVAIKVLPPSRAKNTQVFARFQREARLAIKLKHPHVVRSFLVAETRNLHYLVMEYLEGDPVDEYLQRRKRLPAAEAVRLTYQALLGLQHIHEQGMIHRDLKPANLMLVPGPGRGENDTTLKSNIKVLDIGLAREFFDENSPPPTPEQAELTGEGVILGTPDYLAPEQARDPRSIDIRADIYSLGCVLYHLLTGQPPFPDTNILNQMVRHATEAPRPLAEFNASSPEGLQQILNWMMAKKPEERYPTPARAAQALQAFLMVTNDSLTPPEETAQMKRYLTYLETGAAGDTPVAPAKSDVPAPVQAAKTSLPASQAAAPEKPRKKGTGAPKPSTTNVSSAPTTSSPAQPELPAAMGAPTVPSALPQVAERLDVELVDAQAPTKITDFRLSQRDMVMATIGAGVIVLFYGFCTVSSWILQWFSAE